LAWLRSSGVAARVFLNLPLRKQVEFSVVLMLAGLAEACLRVLPLPRVARLFGIGYSEPSSTPEPTRPGDVQLPSWAIARCRTVTSVMRRWPVDGTCLRHSLVAGQRLRRLSPELVVGVRRNEQGAVEAHAWLRIDGVSLDPNSDAFYELPPAS
jgi:hypothetical protein